MTGALDGVRIVELARYQSGPRGGMIMSDLGAETIKVEKRGGEETRLLAPFVNGASLYFAVYNRGKKSICLDLRTDTGKDVLRDLISVSDLVIENFRPGTLERMGLGYEELCKVKPDIILLRASAFGQYGPYKDRKGFDPLGQAMSGLMMLNGKPIGHPIGTASSIADRYTSLHLTIGALAALRHRDNTGEGQFIDVSLLDAGLTMTEIPTSYYMSTGEEGGEDGRMPYKARDGYFIMGGLTFEMSRTLHEMLGIPLKESVVPTLQISEIDGDIARWAAELSVSEAVAALVDAGIVAAPVYSTPQVVVDPQVVAREMLVKVPDAVAGELYLPGSTIKFSKTPGVVGPVPLPGQHTDEILKEVLGYDDSRIAELRRQEVV